MSLKNILLLFVFSLFLFHRVLSVARHPLIVILLDGFRWDYTKVHGGDGGLQGFEEMAKEGTKATHLNPVFPANSFPNWHTIVTGLYPESHGIVSNYMMDMENKREFKVHDSVGTSNPDWWKAAEPLWITATKHNIKSGLFQWSRCDVKWDNKVPSYCEPYSYNPSGYTGNFTKRLTTALSMIQQENYDLIMVYEGGVDTLGHKYGPLSSQVLDAVKDVDSALYSFWREIDERRMSKSTNVVILSDHGMTGTQPGEVEEVDVGKCLIGQNVDAVSERGGYVNIKPAPGHTTKIMDAIRDCDNAMMKIDMYTKDDVPYRYHYRNNRLIHKIILIAKPGFSITIRGEWDDAYYNILKGEHGYDDTLGFNPDMRGILYARGPDFAKGVETSPVNQIDVYGLLCHILEIPSRPNNGTLTHVNAFLYNNSAGYLFISLMLSVLFIIITAVFLASGMLSYFKY